MHLSFHLESICLSIYLSVYLPSCFFYLSIDRSNLSIYLSIFRLIYLSIYLSTYLSIYLSIDVPIDLSIYRSIDLSFYISIYLSTCLSIHLSIYPSVHLSIHPSIHPYPSHVPANVTSQGCGKNTDGTVAASRQDLVKDALANCRCHDDKDLRKDGKACKASMQQLEQQFRNRKQVAEPVAGSASKPGPVRQPQPPNPPSSREIPKPSPLQQSNLSSPRSSSEIQSCPLSWKKFLRCEKLVRLGQSQPRRHDLTRGSSVVFPSLEMGTVCLRRQPLAS